MACDTVTQPILRLINDAYGLAGNTKSGIRTGGDASLGIRLLNLILASFSGQPVYISYMNILTFEGQGPEIFEYKVGNTSECNVQDSIPTEISHANYNYGPQSGGNNYEIQFLDPDTFDNISNTVVGGWPAYWTYELRSKFTIIRLAPRPAIGTLLKFRCLSRLEDVTYFTSESTLPDKNLLYLTYKLASHLINFNVGNPQPGFFNELAKQEASFVQSNQFDHQTQTRGPPRSIKNSGRSYFRSGRYY